MEKLCSGAIVLGNAISAEKLVEQAVPFLKKSFNFSVSGIETILTGKKDSDRMEKVINEWDKIETNFIFCTGITPDTPDSVADVLKSNTDFPVALIDGELRRSKGEERLRADMKNCYLIRITFA